MLMKSDFTSKIALASLGENSPTSLANENESFVVYSLVVIGLFNLSKSFANFANFANFASVPILD